MKRTQIDPYHPLMRSETRRPMASANRAPLFITLWLGALVCFALGYGWGWHTKQDIVFQSGYAACVEAQAQAARR